MKKLFYPFILLYRLIKTIVLTFLVYTLFTVLILLYLRFFPIPYSSFMQQRENQEIYSFLVPAKLQYEWVSIDEINPNMALAVCASEDQRFPDHWGLDLQAIEKAIKESKRGRRVRGASTISQQTAKNLFLNNDKNYVRKGAEAYFTVLMEGIWSKKRIMEVYLNIAELGEDVYGVKIAANKFFKKEPIKLRTGQCAILAAVIPRPKKFRADRPSGYILRRQSQILTQMGFLGGKTYLEKFL